MKCNAAGRDIIKRSEALRLDAYKCPAGIWTIGYGHTGDVSRGDHITPHEAEAILEVDLDKFEGIVTRAVSVPLNENQFSALVSFVFNVGPGAANVKDGFVTLKTGNPSTMLRRLNARDYVGASLEFQKWTHAAGVELPGLVKRRWAERGLFITTVVTA